MSIKESLMKMLRLHPETRSDIAEFDAEHEELAERLRRLKSDEEMRRKIVEARLRNFRRVD